MGKGWPREEGDRSGFWRTFVRVALSHEDVDAELIHASGAGNALRERINAVQMALQPHPIEPSIFWHPLLDHGERVRVAVRNPWRVDESFKRYSEQVE